MATKESHLKKHSTLFFGPSAKMAWANFESNATFNQALVNYGGFAPLTASATAVNRLDVGEYTLDLTDLPSSAMVFLSYEGDVVGSATYERSGRTITVRLYDDADAAADLDVIVNVLVVYFEEV